MERIHSYGVVGVGETKGKMFKVTEMVEKPPREKAPSNLIITGRYILQPEIFDILATQSRGAGNEIQLTDAMIALAKTQAVLRIEVRGRELRLRIEDRLPRRQCRLCARSPRPRAGVARRDQAADGLSSSLRKTSQEGCSPDGAQRNPGFDVSTNIPHCASLHAGYGLMLVSAALHARPQSYSGSQAQ